MVASSTTLSKTHQIFSQTHLKVIWVGFQHRACQLRCKIQRKTLNRGWKQAAIHGVQVAQAWLHNMHQMSTILILKSLFLFSWLILIILLIMATYTSNIELLKKKITEKSMEYSNFKLMENHKSWRRGWRCRISGWTKTTLFPLALTNSNGAIKR